MSTRAFESATRCLKTNQRALVARNPLLVIAETIMPTNGHRSTFVVVTRAEADGMASRILPRGGSILIHHREGTVTMTPNTESRS